MTIETTSEIEDYEEATKPKPGSWQAKAYTAISIVLTLSLFVGMVWIVVSIIKGS